MLNQNNIDVSDWRKNLNLSLYDRFPNPVVLFDKEHLIRYVNAAFGKLLGFKPLEVLGEKPFFEYLCTDQPSPRLTSFKVSRAIRYQCQVQKKNGDTLWVEVASSPVVLNSTVSGALTIWQDITDLKESQIFNLALDDSPNPIMVEAVDRKILYINHALEIMTGFSSKEMIGKSPPYPWWPDNRKVEYNQANQRWGLKKVNSLERLLVRKDGKVIWASISTRLIKERSQVKYVVINWTDITSRKKVEEELKISEVFNSTLLENAPNPILVSTTDSTIVYANPALERLMGFTLNELKGLKIPYPWWPKEQEPVYGRRYERPNKFRAERQVVTKSGQYLWIDINFATIEDRGQTHYRISNWVDVTERKKLEDNLSHLYQKEKLQRQELEEEARLRGMFINVLAHELRTPITPILASSGTLVNLYKNKKKTLPARLAQNIYNSADILARRLEELLDMARYARGVFQLNLQPVELKSFFEQVVERFKPSLRSGQIFDSIIAKSLPMAYIDASRIEQVVINLLSNAVKFSPGGGVITFKVEISGGNLCVEIKDQGIGISAEAQNKLFQPYYRVEQDQNQFQGLGLGLAVSKQIVEAHKGKIWVTSQKNQGSVFGFQIPIQLSE